MFTISSAAKEYIEKKGGLITIYLQEQIYGGGWCGPQERLLVPAVRLGRPSSSEESLFVTHEAGKITVWQAKNMQPTTDGKSITIDVKRVLFTRQLTISAA